MRRSVSNLLLKANCSHQTGAWLQPGLTQSSHYFYLVMVSCYVSHLRISYFSDFSCAFLEKDVFHW